MGGVHEATARKRGGCALWKFRFGVFSLSYIDSDGFTSFSLRGGALGVAVGLLALGAAAATRADVPPADPAASPLHFSAAPPLRLSVDDAVRLALRENPAVAGTRADARAAAARVRAARSMTRPQASATTYLSAGSMSSILSTPPGTIGPSNFYTVPGAPHADQDLMLMAPLLTGGRLSAGVRSARAGAQAAQSDVASMEEDAALQVKEAYRRVLFTRAAVGVFDERVREEAERSRLAQERYAEGKAAKVEPLRAEADLADAEQARTNAARDADLSLVDLRSAIGLPGDAPIELTDALVYTPETSLPQERAAKALRSRPDLLAARRRVEATEADAARAGAKSRPQVYGIVMGDVNATRRRGSGGGTTLGVTIGWPLLDGGLRRADRDEARARLDRARDDERAVEIRVGNDVQRASLEVAAAAENVTRSQAAVAASEEQYRIAALRYENGKAIHVEVLDALDALTKARVNRLQALYEHSVARDRLAQATGDPALPAGSGAP